MAALATVLYLLLPIAVLLHALAPHQQCLEKCWGTTPTPALGITATDELHRFFWASESGVD
jgi:hypothetical protein